MKPLSDCKDKKEYDNQGSKEWCIANNIDFDIVNAPTLSKYNERVKGNFRSFRSSESETTKEKLRKAAIENSVTKNQNPYLNGKQFKGIKDRTIRNYKNYQKYLEEGKNETAKGTFANVQKDLNLLRNFGYSHTIANGKLTIDKYKNWKL